MKTDRGTTVKPGKYRSMITIVSADCTNSINHISVNDFLAVTKAETKKTEG